VKALVAGWFSFEDMEATAGDLLARELTCEWLNHAGYTYDVALAPPFRGGVNWLAVDPREYSHVLFVCGPFRYCSPLTEFLQRFSGARLVGLNLSMLDPLMEASHPFALLWERDSSAQARPDVTFLSHQSHVPVVGVVLVHPQKEYKERARHRVANQAIQRLVDSREMSIVNIDTRWDMNGTGLRTPAEVESLIARVDVVITTRLHGTVFALKNGVPAVVIDPIAGGAKVHRHAETIGWPIVFTADRLKDEDLQKAYDYCLTAEAREKARECCARAVKRVEAVREQFVAEFRHDRQKVEQ
jgi:hypothetical protein